MHGYDVDSVIVFCPISIDPSWRSMATEISRKNGKIFGLAISNSHHMRPNPNAESHHHLDIYPNKVPSAWTEV